MFYPAAVIRQPYNMKNWTLTEKKTPKDIKAFDGLSANYKQWATRVKDFCQTVDPSWRRVLDRVQGINKQLNRALLSISPLDCLTAADMCEISQLLWMFLGSVLGDTVHQRREALAGGEEGNGLELWRVLYLEHEGGATTCQAHGIRDFHNFP